MSERLNQTFVVENCLLQKQNVRVWELGYVIVSYIILLFSLKISGRKPHLEDELHAGEYTACCCRQHPQWSSYSTLVGPKVLCFIFIREVILSALDSSNIL